MDLRFKNRLPVHRHDRQERQEDFEGDIVRYTDEVTGKEKADEVEYNETHAAFCRLHKGEMGVQYLFIDESIADRCEVTGNIYDNPAPADAT